MRVFVEERCFFENYIQLTLQQFHHFSRVLRIQKYECLDLVVIDKVVYRVRFLYFSNSQLFFDSKICLLELNNQNVSRFNVTVVQGLPKQDKMDTIVDNLTQCGVRTIVPVFMERSIVKWSSEKQKNKILRWQHISEKAAMQSQYSFLPSVERIFEFGSWVNLLQDRMFDLKIVAWEEHRNMFVKSLLTNNKQVKNICLVIGPEGGMSNNEVKMLSEKDFKIISLGDTIFKVELAGVIAMTHITCA